MGPGRQSRFGVKGTRQGKVTVWRGVPYAAAPTGEGRFRPPGPTPPWNGPRSATSFGPSSISTEVPGLVLPSGSGVQPESEDCLYLNVWSPRAKGKPRPVVVWVHGGAFVFGSGSNFDGAWLAGRGQAVVVTINYRLGPWGFLDLATVGGAGFDTAVNVALLDQVAALEWVRDNIEAFGGDPERVTLIGQASGATCVGSLLAMPAAAGLFHRAVLQSGAADRVQSRWRSRAVVVRMLNQLGIDYREATRLEALPVEAIRTAAATLLRDADDAELEGEPFVPIVDGRVLPGHPLAGLVAGSSSQVPLLVSTCREEANLYLAISPEGFIKAKELRARAWFGDVAWENLMQTYQKGAPTSDRGRADLLGDLLFGIPAVRTAEAHHRGGGRTWMMRFDHTPGQVPFDQLGPCHGSDLPFTWLDYTGPPEAAFPGLSTNADRTVAETLQDVILAFARTGDPGTPMLPAWPSYQPGRRAVMSIDSRSSLEIDPSAERRRAWDSLPLPQTLNIRRSSRSTSRQGGAQPSAAPVPLIAAVPSALSAATAAPAPPQRQPEPTTEPEVQAPTPPSGVPTTPPTTAPPTTAPPTTAPPPTTPPPTTPPTMTPPPTSTFELGPDPTFAPRPSLDPAASPWMPPSFQPPVPPTFGEPFQDAFEPEPTEVTYPLPPPSGEAAPSLPAYEWPAYQWPAYQWPAEQQQAPEEPQGDEDPRTAVQPTTAAPEVSLWDWSADEASSDSAGGEPTAMWSAEELDDATTPRRDSDRPPSS